MPTPPPHENVHDLAEQLESIIQNFRECGGYRLSNLADQREWLSVPLHIKEIELIISRL